MVRQPTILLATLLVATSAAIAETRTREGLLALYDFRAESGALVKDRSGVGKPLDLEVTKLGEVRRMAGSLEIRGSTQIRSKSAAKKISDAIRRSRALTVEAWIQPSNLKQSGPARIITLSRNSTNRNITVGQDGGKYDVRLRTTQTSSNGIPSTSAKNGSAAKKLTHLVYTRDRKGQARIYVNGKKNVEKQVGGNASNWDASYRLALGDEFGGGRAWRGTYHLVAIFDRALSSEEIARHFEAGVVEESPEVIAARRAERLAKKRAHHFETKIAPIIADRCLECHDSSTKKGKIDLSRKLTAFGELDDELVIAKGKSTDSLLWESIESNDMPKKRDPLTAEEKKLLREWIDDGATWTLDVIDPAVYVHGGEARKNFVRRLTVDEYIETVRAVTGVDIAKEARETLPKDLRADGFSNTAYNLGVDLKHIGAYSKLAELVVSKMDVPAFTKRFVKRQRFTDRDMGNLISRMGEWILRGPASEREIIAYRGISTTVASANGSYEEATALIIEGMLQSPRFLYRIENQVGDGSAVPVGEHELASRLSYTIWGGPPDRQLLEAAKKGELDRDGVRSQVARMLEDPRAIDHSLRFANEWLNLGRLENLRPNKKKFPKWNPKLARDMRDETIAFFREIVWTQKRPLADLLNAQVAFLTPELSEHYGIEKAALLDSTKLARYDMSKIPSRGGLLTQGSLLTIGGDEGSTVTRGLFVMHELLRGVVKDPPPCVDTAPVASKPGLTQRAIAESRIADKRCGGCHAKFEPLSFGLGKFDGLGTYHEKDEHGNELRDDGVILFPGEAKPVTYKSSRELMDRLAQSDRVSQSITWKVTQFALGRPLGAKDASIVESIHRDAKKNGGTYASLITAVVTSDLVQRVQTESDSAD